MRSYKGFLDAGKAWGGSGGTTEYGEARAERAEMGGAGCPMPGVCRVRGGGACDVSPVGEILLLGIGRQQGMVRA